MLFHVFVYIFSFFFYNCYLFPLFSIIFHIIQVMEEKSSVYNSIAFKEHQFVLTKVPGKQEKLLENCLAESFFLFELEIHTGNRIIRKQGGKYSF